ncbi:unnamed protein product [Oppiella nova]|uniref:Transposase n=1 Tax=Oppiella nova TaxID=334625 RepID=A0A7R9QSP6_9ACAR|nr:unnamed protein product [Oppiella nova]CAG2174001.1 unnamed protein product [Oppiella nova]
MTRPGSNPTILKIRDRLVNGYSLNKNREPKILKSELRKWKCMMMVALWKKQVLTYEILADGVIVDHVAYLNFLERSFCKIKDGRNLTTPHIALICHRRIWTESSALKPQTRGSNSKLEMSSFGIMMRQ